MTVLIGEKMFKSENVWVGNCIYNKNIKLVSKGLLYAFTRHLKEDLDKVSVDLLTVLINLITIGILSTQKSIACKRVRWLKTVLVIQSCQNSPEACKNSF